MGLDTSHDCWHGPYTAFHRFRVGLAAEIGIDLNAMEGFGRSFATPMEPTGAMTWEALKDDPINIFLRHSDCDGSIDSADCGPIAKRLREIAETIPPAKGASGLLDGIREAALQFAAGLELADSRGEDVEFH